MEKRKLKQYPVRMLRNEDVGKLPAMPRKRWDNKSVVAVELWEKEGEPLLVLNVYDYSELEQEIYRPHYRVFQTETEYAIQDLEREEWRNCSLLYLLIGSKGWRGYPFNRIVDILDKESEQLIREYFHEDREDTDAMGSVYRAQGLSIDRKREKRNEKKQEKVDRKMEHIVPAGQSFEKWTEEEGLYWSRFIFYKYSRKKQMQGWCTHCKQEVVLEKGVPRHNKEGICPACKSPVTFIASGRKPHFMYHWVQVSKLEKVDGKILYREFFVHKHYKGIYPETWEYGCSEQLRIFLDKDGGTEVYAQDYWAKGRWHKSKKTAHATTLYPGDVKETLSDTPYKYCALSEYIKSNPREALYPMGYLEAYRIFPGLEYFIKTGMYKMVLDIMESPYQAKKLKEGKRLQDVLEIASQQEMELARSNMLTFWEFQKAQQFLRAGVKMTNNELACFFHLYGADNRFLEENKLLPLKKLVAYIAKQVERFGDVPGFSLNQNIDQINYKTREEHGRFLQLWRDYVRFMKALGYELAGENVLCPFDLLKEHDRVHREYQKLLDKKAQAEKRRQDRALKKKLLKEGELLDGKIKNKKYQLVVPKSAADIRREGNILGHCVCSYTTSVLSGGCQIYFIRKKEDMETPYYTVEWRDGKIQQCRGKKNCGYNKDMERFLKSAEKKLNKIKEPPEKAA